MATSGDYTPPSGEAQAKSAPTRTFVRSLSLLLYLARRSGQKWPEPCSHLCHLSSHEGLIAQLLVSPMVLSYKWETKVLANCPHQPVPSWRPGLSSARIVETYQGRSAGPGPAWRSPPGAAPPLDC